ncbi:MAG: protein-glutamate O-methyltransferase CheR [Oscillospiraceae bacterium]|nr:protein-glutamate O-methyltransferase CheR [Oscillospiraceae bacterium]
MLNLSDEMFAKLAYYLRANYGINLEQKRTLAEGRLSQSALKKGFRDLDDYVCFAFDEKSGKELSIIVNRLTTNHTYFMREPEHFKFLSSVIMPYLEQTVEDKDLRIWCAGCSTGQEAYSIAMVIDDYFGFRKAGWDCVVLATDINTEALHAASDAWYPPDGLTGLSEEQVTRYFEKQTDGSYRICESLRNQVIFKRFNLMEPIVYKKPFDLISCRNVTIYFDQQTKDGLVERFYDCTKPGGYLFMGHAENISRFSAYEYIQPAIFRRPPE